MQRNFMYTKKDNVQYYGNVAYSAFLVRKLYTEQMFVLVSMHILRMI